MADKRVDTEEAKRALAVERRRRTATCAEEVRVVLSKHGCRLSLSAIITEEGTRMQAEIVALE